MSFSKPIYNFMLLGKTGYGKSSTGNTLINRKNIFKASNRMNSCTQEPKLDCGSFEKYDIKVVDTPGLKDTNVDMPVTLDHIGNAMALLPDGFDALLLVMKYGERCTKEVIEVITALRATCGEIFAKEYCIIVMTHGEIFDMDMADKDDPETFDDYCKNIKEPPEILSLVKECDYRVVLFYNKTEAKREDSIKTLLQHVKNMKSRCQRYNADIFAKCAKERNKHLISLKLPQLIPSIQEKLSFLNEALEKSIENPDANSNFELKIKAQQLLDTIELESNGTSLMDGLKMEVRTYIRTLDALTLQNEKRKEKEKQEQREKEEQKQKEEQRKKQKEKEKQEQKEKQDQKETQEEKEIQEQKEKEEQRKNQKRKEKQERKKKQEQVKKQKEKEKYLQMLQENEKYRQTLQNIRDSAENMKNPPACKSGKSGLKIGLFGVICALCAAATPLYPPLAVVSVAAFVVAIKEATKQ